MNKNNTNNISTPLFPKEPELDKWKSSCVNSVNSLNLQSDYKTHLNKLDDLVIRLLYNKIDNNNTTQSRNHDFKLDQPSIRHTPTNNDSGRTYKSTKENTNKQRQSESKSYNKQK
jgi:hypothetical protein